LLDVPSEHFLITIHTCNNGIAKRCPFFFARVRENFRKTKTIDIFYVLLLDWKKTRGYVFGKNCISISPEAGLSGQAAWAKRWWRSRAMLLYGLVLSCLW